MAFRARGKQIINSIASVSTGKLPLYKKLWENPNPTSAFAAQTITLLSDDYDFLLYAFKNSNSGSLIFTSVVQKGFSTALLYSIPYSDAVFSARRQVDYASATSLAFYDAYGSNNGSTPQALNNSVCIPVAIYGFKKEVDVQSVIASVSTEASKCMLSDEITDVETELNKKVEGWTLAGNVTSTSLVTVTVPATAKEILAVLVNPNNVILLSQVIPKALMSSGASLKDVANTSKELYSNGSKWKVTDSTYTGKIYYR